MSNCFSCKKKFALLNLDRKRCKECEQYFCYTCMPTIFGVFCKTCKILNTRPVIQSMIVKLRSRELKMYLIRRKIQTDACIEKDDLIKCFFKYVSLEPQLKNKRSYTKFANLNSYRCSSTPDLIAGNRQHEATQPNTPPPRTYYPSQEGPSMDSASSSRTQSNIIQPSVPPENSYADLTSNSTNTDALINETQNLENELNEDNFEDNSRTETFADVKHIKLSNIKELEDIQTLSIKQLKELLTVNRVDYKGCVEKDELRNKVVQLWKESQQKPDVTNMPTGELCKICMDAPLNSVLLECGHIVSCIDCGKQLAECPVCRQYVVRVVHTFKA